METIRAKKRHFIFQFIIRYLIMKTLSVIAALFFLLFISCKKDGGGDNYYVKFTVDGVNKSYTGYVFAHEDNTSGYSVFTVNGASSGTSFNDYLGIYIDNFPTGASISAGVYLDNSPDYSVLTTYAFNGGEYESGETVAEEAIANSVTITNHFKVTITERSGNTVRGTFSGDYYEGGDVENGDKITITNGEFYAKFE